jgi:hypothetical protein
MAVATADPSRSLNGARVNAAGGESDVRACAGVRKRDGAPCGSRVVLDDGYCPAHSPTRGVEMAELGRVGGLASGEVRREQAKTVRDRLREKVEENTDRIWTVYDQAMNATAGDGEADHRARLASVEGVLSQAYGRPPVAIIGDADKPVTFVLGSLLQQARDEIGGNGRPALEAPGDDLGGE